VEQAANAIAPPRDADGALTLPESGKAEGAEAPLTGLRRSTKRAIGGVRVQGETDILIKFAKCCSPVPGDPIIGFVSRGHGVVIHTPDCEKALALDPARRLDVSWDDESKTLRPVTVEVQAEDRPGLLASISRAFTENGVNISQAKCRTSDDGKAVNTFQVSVGHVDQLKSLLRNLQAIEGVVSAERC
jgi:GTP pyrophosphokinase